MSTPVSKPLASVISAPSGTKAGKVLEKIQELLQKRPNATTRCVFDGVLGVHLTPVLGSSFSPKYKMEGEVYRMFVGDNVPDGRIEHVAQNILAIVLRGDGWLERGTDAVMVAYGRAPQPPAPNSRRSRRRGRATGGILKSERYWGGC